MPNYSNGKIYTIRFHNSNEIYIGSTTQSLAVRFGGHKKDETISLNKLINSKYNGNWSECYYELYENYSSNSKEELRKREGEIIRQFKSDKNYTCINHKVAGRTKKEYNKQYRNDNLDIIKRKKNEKITCECGSCICKSNLSYHLKTKKHQYYLASLT
jgi:hypothetical protein